MIYELSQTHLPMSGLIDPPVSRILFIDVAEEKMFLDQLAPTMNCSCPEVTHATSPHMLLVIVKRVNERFKNANMLCIMKVNR